MASTIQQPDTGEFRQALVVFVWTAACVTSLRCRELGPRRMATVAMELAMEFEERFNPGLAREVLNGPLEISRTAMGALFEELVYIACKYERAREQMDVTLAVVGNVQDYQDVRGSAFSREAVDDIETVKDSIAWFLDKLPKPLRDVLDALLEALKLSRGG